MIMLTSRDVRFNLTTINPTEDNRISIMNKLIEFIRLHMNAKQLSQLPVIFFI